MIIILVSGSDIALRGKLSRWIVSLHPGCHVGVCSTRVREALITLLRAEAEWAVVIWGTKNSVGYNVLNIGSPPHPARDPFDPDY